MHHDGTAPVPITLPPPAWHQVAHGLMYASIANDSRGRCDCPDAIVSIWNMCAAAEAAALTWLHLAKQLKARLGDGTRRLTQVHTVKGWREIVVALEEGAAYLEVGIRLHSCGGSCGDCVEWRGEVHALRALAARIDRRSRRARARTGRPGAVDLLPTCLISLDPVVQLMVDDLGDLLGDIAVKEGGRVDLYALLHERRDAAAYLARRPLRPRGSRPHHPRRRNRRSF
jgi:hypothetical protein